MKTTRVFSVLMTTAVLIAMFAALVPAQEIRDFSLETLGGDTFSMSEYLGDKVVVMTFWASWCVPCKKEHPHLQRLYDKYKDDGLAVVGINVDEPGNLAKVRSHVRRYKLTFPILLDSDSSITRIYNPDLSFPYTLLINKNGAVVRTYQGYVPGDETKLEEDIATIMGK